MRRRREFSEATRHEAFERSGGLCECHRVWQLPTRGTGCGGKLTIGNTFYEHIEPDALDGRNDLDNCAVLVKTCFRLKTDGYDRPAIDKDRRLRNFARGIARLSRSPMPGGRADPRKRTVDGRVVDRRTGERWGTR